MSDAHSRGSMRGQSRNTRRSFLQGGCASLAGSILLDRIGTTATADEASPASPKEMVGFIYVRGLIDPLRGKLMPVRLAEGPKLEEYFISEAKKYGVHWKVFPADTPDDRQKSIIRIGLEVNNRWSEPDTLLPKHLADIQRVVNLDGDYLTLPGEGKVTSDEYLAGLEKIQATEEAVKTAVSDAFKGTTPEYDALKTVVDEVAGRMLDGEPRKDRLAANMLLNEALRLGTEIPMELWKRATPRSGPIVDLYLNTKGMDTTSLREFGATLKEETLSARSVMGRLSTFDASTDADYSYFHYVYDNAQYSLRNLEQGKPFNPGVFVEIEKAANENKTYLGNRMYQDCELCRQICSDVSPSFMEGLEKLPGTLIPIQCCSKIPFIPRSISKR
ncbi:hypothetical protein SH139x_001337 [Planctomycetaceae bacterium SH139]